VYSTLSKFVFFFLKIAGAVDVNNLDTEMLEEVTSAIAESGLTTLLTVSYDKEFNKLIKKIGQNIYF